MQEEEPCPSRLGSFEILGKLGEGGSAFVYAAKDGDREVALKVLRDDVGLDSREVDRFLDEADRMRRLRHPALVSVVRAGLLPGGRPYIAMPRLVGRSLADRLTSGPIPLPQALALFADVASAVSLLHESGLIHRDIKPENVFNLEPENRLVLLDLGIARDASGVPSTTTRAGMMRGTPAYMAPERLFGKQASIRSDVYELTLLLYAMLTTCLPWDEGDARGRVDPVLPAQRGVHVPAGIVAVLLKGLSFDVDKRLPTVGALMEELQQVGSLPTAETELRSSDVPRQAFPTGPSPTVGAAPLPHAINTQSTQLSAFRATDQRASFGATTPLDPALIQGAISNYPSQSPSYGPGYPSGYGAAPYSSLHTGERAVSVGSMPPRSSAQGSSLLLVGGLIAMVAAGASALIVFLFLRRPDAPQVSARVDDAEGESVRATAALSSAAPPPIGAPNSPASASAETGPSPQESSNAQASGSGPQSEAKPGAPSSPRPSASSVVSAPATVSAPPAPSTAKSSPGSMPPSCAAFIALMCNPSSGARPEECTAWKENVARWQATMSPAQTAEVCSTAHSNSKKGLEMRRSSSGPPSTPAAPKP